MRFGDERLPERFWSKVEQRPDGCWVWTASLRGGYGQFYWEGGPRYAHRVAYGTLIGPIPEGLVTDHLCARTACVNPLHLEPVPQGENIKRGYAPVVARGLLAKLNKSRTCSDACRSGKHAWPEWLGYQPSGTRYCLGCAREGASARWYARRAATT